MTYVVTPDPTPNPNAMRFEFDEGVFGGLSLTMGDKADADGMPWAEALFDLPGVEGLFAREDFVTVTKDPEIDWSEITPQVITILQTADF